MPEKEFMELNREIEEQEKENDRGRRQVNFGMCHKGLLEKLGMMKFVKGKTRITIEFDGDTGKGWKRIVNES